MNRVVIESPFRSNDILIAARNLNYARRCILDSLMRGEAPFASHLLYTQSGVLDDRIPTQRRMGILAGLEWGKQAHLVAVYTDLGITDGMRTGIETYRHASIPIEFRTIDG